MKKIEIVVVIILIVSFGIYFIPAFFVEDVEKQNANIKANAAMMSSKLISQFSEFKDIKAQDVVFKSIEEYNKKVKNPVSKSKEAYYAGEKCRGCVNLVYEEGTQNVLLEGYDKDFKPIIKTAIRGSSFVTSGE